MKSDRTDRCDPLLICTFGSYVHIYSTYICFGSENSPLCQAILQLFAVCLSCVFIFVYIITKRSVYLAVGRFSFQEFLSAHD